MPSLPRTLAVYSPLTPRLLPTLSRGMQNANLQQDVEHLDSTSTPPSKENTGKKDYCVQAGTGFLEISSEYSKTEWEVEKNEVVRETTKHDAEAAPSGENEAKNEKEEDEDKNAVDVLGDVEKPEVKEDVEKLEDVKEKTVVEKPEDVKEKDWEEKLEDVKEKAAVEKLEYLKERDFVEKLEKVDKYEEGIANQLPGEIRFQFLEQKYGFYHCRDCNIRWESAYVWCIAGTNKVYFKQLCRSCQKEYNPYRVEDIICKVCGASRCECEIKRRHVDLRRPHRQELCCRCRGRRLSCDNTFSFKYIL
uniref:zygote arrest protein 1-like isoform X2 n=1 Tax=Myxine glutinosa TaxID=7769 RepID=UPI00358F8E83